MFLLPYVRQILLDSTAQDHFSALRLLAIVCTRNDNVYEHKITFDRNETEET